MSKLLEVSEMDRAEVMAKIKQSSSIDLESLKYKTPD